MKFSYLDNTDTPSIKVGDICTSTESTYGLGCTDWELPYGSNVRVFNIKIHNRQILYDVTPIYVNEHVLYDVVEREYFDECDEWDDIDEDEIWDEVSVRQVR